MAKQVLNDRATYLEQRIKINANFTEVYDDVAAIEADTTPQITVAYSGDSASPVTGDRRLTLETGLYEEYNGTSWEEAGEGAFAYLNVAADTVLTDADEWYLLSGAFTNTIAKGFSAAADGITYDNGTKTFLVHFTLSGQSDKTARICIGIVKDATFDVNGKLATGTFLDGSRGSVQTDVIGSSDGCFQLISIWPGEIESGDRLTLVLQSNIAATTVTSNCAAASIHGFY